MTERLPRLTPSDLDAARRALFDTIVASRRAGGTALTGPDGSLAGPFNALLYRPELGDAVQRVGAALRFSGGLPDRLRELAILTVAAAWGSRFEASAHEPVALAAGATAEQLDDVRCGHEPNGLDDAERAGLSLVRALLRDRRVDAPTHAAAVAALGHAGTVELVVLVGYYQLLAGVLEAFGGDP